MKEIIHKCLRSRTPKFVILLSMMFPAVVLSQNQWFEIPYNETPTNVIIREYSYPEVITYQEENGLELGACHSFCYTDLLSVDHSVRIKPEIDVKDFIIVGDTIFFCGIYNGNVPEGCVGWFQYGDFFNGGHEYYFYHKFPTVSGYVSAFTHLTLVYDSTREIKIALVGESTSGLACVAEMSNATGSAIWNCSVGESPIGDEIISQICATDKYVVTAGLSEILYSTENIRVYDKISMFNTLSDFLYAYSSNNTPPTAWVSTPPGGITHLYGDLFSVAASSQVDYYGVTPFGFGVKTNVYDASAISPIFGLQPVYSIVNEFYTAAPNPLLPLSYPSNLPDVRGIVYSTSASTLAVLMNEDFQMGSNNVVAEIAVPPTTNIRLSSFCCSDQTSISLYNGDTSFIVAGGSTAFTNSKSVHSRTFGNLTTLCSNLEPRYNLNNYEFASKYERLPFEVKSSKYEFYKSKADPYIEPDINKICPTGRK